MTSFVGQYEYVYLFTQSEALWPGEIRVRGSDPFANPASVTSYEKNGTDLTFTVETAPGDYSIELPLLYYPGYEVTGDGCGSIEMTRGTNNVIMLNVKDMSGKAAFHVWFRTPVNWTAATLFSACGGILLLFLVFRDVKRHKAVRKDTEQE